MQRNVPACVMGPQIASGVLLSSCLPHEHGATHTKKTERAMSIKRVYKTHTHSEKLDGLYNINGICGGRGSRSHPDERARVRDVNSQMVAVWLTTMQCTIRRWRAHGSGLCVVRGTRGLVIRAPCVQLGFFYLGERHAPYNNNDRYNVWALYVPTCAQSRTYCIITLCRIRIQFVLIITMFMYILDKK